LDMSKVMKRWPCKCVPDESTTIPTGKVTKADVASPPSPLIKSPPATVEIVLRILASK